MEDENGLELSLGLSCGGSSVKPKSKHGNSRDTREEFVRGGKMVDEFKSIFDTSPQKPYPVTVTRRTHSSKPEENFFSDLSKARGENASLNLNARGFWVANSKKPVQIEEDKQLETRHKRKMSFDEINHQDYRSNLHHKARTSHISMTEDGSAAKNEDVTDSKAENSTSRPISHHGDGSKRIIRVSVSSDAPKDDVRGVADSRATDFNGEKRFTSSPEKYFKHAKLTYDVQQVNMKNTPYPSQVRESNSVHAPSPRICGMMPTATGEHSGAQLVSNENLPVMFGYSSVQTPMLDKDNSWGYVSHPQQLHISFAGSSPPNIGKPLERSKGDGKQRVTEEGSSPHPEDMKGSNANLRAKDVPDKSTGEGSSIDFSVIKPGLAANVKFGGGGSCPNLPWVSTTGLGSNGRTLSGVTYGHSTNQIRIVCACHGSHMTPEEFVQHADEDQANLEGSAVLGTAANGNPATFAHS